MNYVPEKVKPLIFIRFNYIRLQVSYYILFLFTLCTRAFKSPLAEVKRDFKKKCTYF